MVLHHRWLTLLVITFIATLVFIFFFLRLRPVWTPDKDKGETTSTITTVDTPTITFVDPKKGATEPQVTIVEFGDFQCQPCKDLAAALDIVIRTEPGVQVIWKDLPNESLHSLAVSAAIAARCAGSQGKFWEFHNSIFNNQAVLSETRLTQISTEVGLDTEKFTECYTNQETLPLVKKDFDEGAALQITATPILFIGKERISGALSAEEILTIVRQQMSTATIK